MVRLEQKQLELGARPMPGRMSVQLTSLLNRVGIADGIYIYRHEGQHQ